MYSIEKNPKKFTFPEPIPHRLLFGEETNSAKKDVKTPLPLDRNNMGSMPQPVLIKNLPGFGETHSTTKKEFMIQPVRIDDDPLIKKLMKEIELSEERKQKKRDMEMSRMKPVARKLYGKTEKSPVRRKTFVPTKPRVPVINKPLPQSERKKEPEKKPIRPIKPVVNKNVPTKKKVLDPVETNTYNQDMKTMLELQNLLLERISSIEKKMELITEEFNSKKCCVCGLKRVDDNTGVLQCKTICNTDNVNESKLNDESLLNLDDTADKENIVPDNSSPGVVPLTMSDKKTSNENNQSLNENSRRKSVSLENISVCNMNKSKLDLNKSVADIKQKTLISYHNLMMDSVLCSPKLEFDSAESFMTPSVLQSKKKFLSRKLQQQIYMLNED